MVFLDLTCAYGTVWKRGLFLKLTNILKCKITLQTIDSILSDRKCQVRLNRKKSKLKYLQNSIFQDSVLSQILFNVYKGTIASTISRKCTHADDKGLIA